MVEIIGQDAGAVAEVRAAADVLVTAAKPCGDVSVAQAMQPLFVVYGHPKKLASEMPQWFGLYYEALGSLPREALDHAVSEYIRVSTIHMIPAPGILTDLADAKATELRRAGYRARLVAMLPPPEEVKRPTDEQREEAKAFLESLKAGGGFVKKPPEPERPKESREALSNRLRAAAEAQAKRETPEAF